MSYRSSRSASSKKWINLNKDVLRDFDVAIINSDISKIESILKKYRVPSEYLTFALIKNKPRVARVLLRYKYINPTINNGAPLRYAVLGNHTIAVRDILKRKIDVNNIDFLIRNATENSRYEILDELLRYNKGKFTVKIDTSPLTLAIDKQDPVLINTFLKNANKKVLSRLLYTNYVSYAVKNNRINSIKILRESKYYPVHKYELTFAKAIGDAIDISNITALNELIKSQHIIRKGGKAINIIKTKYNTPGLDKKMKTILRKVIGTSDKSFLPFGRTVKSKSKRTLFSRRKKSSSRKKTTIRDIPRELNTLISEFIG